MNVSAIISCFNSDSLQKKMFYVNEESNEVNVTNSSFSKYENPVVVVDWRKAQTKQPPRRVVIDTCKFSSSSFGKPHPISNGKLVKWINAPIIILGPLDKDAIRLCEIVIRNCTFSEIGYHNKVLSLTTGCIYVDNVQKLNIEGCTIDGCVGSIQSFAINIFSVEDALVKDVFFTDIYSKKDSRALFYDDCNLSVQQCPQTGILKDIDVDKIENYLKEHPSYKEEVALNSSSLLEAIHLRHIVPFHKDNFEKLLHEHKWREFRTLDRLVCHQADKRSETTALYAKWVEHLCQFLFQVKVKVVVAFANLYPSGETTLPFHRDQYHKWVIGLSFGETRKFLFKSDDPKEKDVSFDIEAGDVLIFSPDTNNYYQHGIPLEPNRKEKRINLTFFVDILEPLETSEIKLKFLSTVTEENRLTFSQIPFLFSN